MLEAQPDPTLDEVCAALGPAGAAPSRVSIWRFFRRHGISVKKNGARVRAGTAYRAANWKHLGYTQGRGKLDRHHRRELPRKSIWIQPLQTDWKDVLRR